MLSNEGKKSKKKVFNLTGDSKPIFDLDLESLMESSENKENDSAIESILGSPVHVNFDVVEIVKMKFKEKRLMHLMKGEFNLK